MGSPSFAITAARDTVYVPQYGRSAPEICHGDSRGRFQTDVIRQIRVAQRWRHDFAEAYSFIAVTAYILFVFLEMVGPASRPSTDGWHH